MNSDVQCQRSDPRQWNISQYTVVADIPDAAFLCPCLTQRKTRAGYAECLQERALEALMIVAKKVEEQNKWPWERLLSRQWSRLGKSLGILLITVGGAWWITKRPWRRRHHAAVSAGGGTPTHPPPMGRQRPLPCAAPTEWPFMPRVEVSRPPAETPEALFRVDTYSRLIERLIEKIEPLPPGSTTPPVFYQNGSPLVRDLIVETLVDRPDTLAEKVQRLRATDLTSALNRLLHLMPNELRRKMIQARRREKETAKQYRRRLRTMDPSLREVIEKLAKLLKKAWERQWEPWLRERHQKRMQQQEMRQDESQEEAMPEEEAQQPAMRHMVWSLIGINHFFGEPLASLELQFEDWPDPEEVTTAFLVKHYDEIFRGKEEC